MPDKDHIRILPAHRLDKGKWDACVAHAANGLIYSFSWYLDLLAGSWLGIVVNDYEAVMALPLKRKWGLNMVAMPPFVQRLGLTGPAEAQAKERVEEAATGVSRLIQYAADDETLFAGYPLRRRTNLVLPLNRTYESVEAGFSQGCKKNLRQAERRGCRLTAETTVEQTISLYRQAYSGVSAYREAHYSLLERLLHEAAGRKALHLAGVQNEQGRLVYSGALLDDGKRLYYILGAPDTEGRQIRATYFFIASMLRQFAGSGKIFDFEGSDLPDVAAFYRSFDSREESYFQSYVNNYPFPFNKLLDMRLRPF